MHTEKHTNSQMNYDSRFAAICGDSKVAKPHARTRTTESTADASHTVSIPCDAEFLKNLLTTKLLDAQIIVVSNRQPFSHEQSGGDIKLVHPASGLITALEPVVRACSGTWIAHGSGAADKQCVDDYDRCLAPDDKGTYRLRRIWITAEQEQGYCDGFANSGLWPLSHMVHVRPVLSAADWKHYKDVNQKFANAVVHEARGADPVVLVQDYHLALVPGLVRQKLPRATIISFWHIPWPHPEQMSMCPWLPEILDGLLGSDIVGMQTPQHVRNFVELTKRSNKQVSSGSLPEVMHSTYTTKIRDYPISIAWPTAVDDMRVPSVAACRLQVRTDWGVPANGYLMVGVDRFDYSKGIIERLLAFEALLDMFPQWVGLLRFVQIASPTRVKLKEYTNFQLRVFAEVSRINGKFAACPFEPILLLNTHHSREALNLIYRAADVCVVTSLHDGMNLVCKEFVAARTDEQGVLVLSQFAGAANELVEALVVNPYHTVEVVNALNTALTMSFDEQGRRMKAMRATVKEANVYKWAASMLRDAADLRDAATLLERARQQKKLRRPSNLFKLSSLADKPSQSVLQQRVG